MKSKENWASLDVANTITTTHGAAEGSVAEISQGRLARPMFPAEKPSTARRAAGGRVTAIRVLKLLFLLLVLLWFVQSGLTFLIQHSRLRRVLTAQLTAAFGRPVEVGRYKFTLLEGPVLEAHAFSLGEDPRFGHEYFLRAEVLRLRLNWHSLLVGHLDFGTISLGHPSLNLVHNADGSWNVAEWLPRPPEEMTENSAGRRAVGPSALSSGVASLSFKRLEVESGRINFKRGDDKAPFAFTDVTGFVEPDGPGRWRMDLTALLARAAVVVQQTGILHVTGHVGGTSSRLRPAALQLTWTDASVSDVLRLLRGYDYGVRGSLNLSLSGATQNPNESWQLRGRAELRELHRWDLAPRADDPALNLISNFQWDPTRSAIYLEDLGLETPRSNAHARGGLSWEPARVTQKRPVSPLDIEVKSVAVDAGELLAAYRAFHPGVAEDISARGVIEARGILRGWPLRIVNLSIESAGAELAGPSLRVPVHLSQVGFSYDHGLDHLEPLILIFGPSGSALRVEAVSKSRANSLPDLRLSGNLSQIRDVISTAGALGWDIARSWDMSGPVRLDLRWAGGRLPWQSRPTGFVEWGSEHGGMLQPPFLNRPIEQIKARADWNPNARRIVIASAEAFGARWSGTIDRRELDAGWHFLLSADHVSGADLDRWLNPRWRQPENFLARVLPFLNSSTPPSAMARNLLAAGKVNIDQFSLVPLTLRKLTGDLSVSGHTIDLTHAHAQFFGGQLDGSFTAELAAVPLYRAAFDFSQLDLRALASVSPALADQFGGTSSGRLALSARGTGRADLLSSIACRGNIAATYLELRNSELASLFRGASLLEAVSFPEASASFTCSDRKIVLQSLVLRAPTIEWDGGGSVDFTQSLDLRLRAHSLAPSFDEAGVSKPQADFYRVSGPFAAPQIVRLSPPPSLP